MGHVRFARLCRRGRHRRHRRHPCTSGGRAAARTRPRQSPTLRPRRVGPGAVMLAGDDAQSDASAAAAEEDAAAPRPAVWRVARLADDPAMTIVDGTLGKRPLLAALGAAGLPRSESHRVVSLARGRARRRIASTRRTRSRSRATRRAAASSRTRSPARPSTCGRDARTRRTDGTMRLVARKLELPSERVRVRKAVLVGADLRASFADGGPRAHRRRAHDARRRARRPRRARRHPPGRAPPPRRDRTSASTAPSCAGRRSTPSSTSRRPRARRRCASTGSTRTTTAHGWYDAKGRAALPRRAGARRCPSRASRRAFNPHRMHPVLHVVMPHNGVDLRGADGHARLRDRRGDRGERGQRRAVRQQGADRAPGRHHERLLPPLALRGGACTSASTSRAASSSRTSGRPGASRGRTCTSASRRTACSSTR